MKRKSCLIMALALTASLVAGCGSSGQQQGQTDQGTTAATQAAGSGGSTSGGEGEYKDTIIWAISNDQDYLDPQMNVSNSVVIPQYYDGLLGFDNDGNVVCKIAESYESSDDKMVWTFHLRDDVYFHSGRHCTAQDFEATFDRLLDKEHPVRYTTNYSYIESAKATDDYTFVVTLAEPKSFFLQSFAKHQTAVLNLKRSRDKRNKRVYKRESVGELAGSIFSGGIPSTSNETYWNGQHNWLSSGETCDRFIVSTIKTITDAGVSNSSTRKANEYDIVIASAGQGHTRGQASMLLTDTYVNQSIIVVHAASDYLPYLFWNIANRYEELRVISNSNSIRGSLTTKMIGSLSIPKANITRIQQFSDYAWPIIKAVENNLHENRRLAVMRDTLLPRLMSGELDVSALDL